MRGGKRPNAGRKAGAPNKASAAREAAVKASGITPLDYLLKVMRNSATPTAMRLDAAKAAAPYVHPKLSSVELKGDPENPVEQRVTVVDEKAVAAAVAKVESDY
ncbi:hypothetical protein CH75_06455 [Dyella jiangningensis]|nr:hypothetical protein CH75_06455 [Dyella jiangningensis]